MARYSHSKISAFEQCRYKYRLKYVDKIKTDVKTVEAFMGSMVHAALEKLYKDLGYCKKNSLEELLAHYDSKWDAEFTDDILIAKGDYTEQNYKDMGRGYIARYYEDHDPFDQMTILGLETQNSMDLGGGRTYDVRIDKFACVGSTYYVCDYKTNSRMMTQEDADGDRQLAMYSKWVKDTYADAENVKLVWHMLKFGKDVVSERTDAKLDELVNRTVAVIDEIERCNEWPTTESNLCGWCEYHDRCPLFSHGEAIAEMTPEAYAEDDGLKLVNRYAEVSETISGLEDEKKDLSDKLVQYSQQTGHTVIYGDSAKISVTKDKKFEYPKDGSVEEALKAKGLYENYSHINSLKFLADTKKGLVDPDIVSMAKVSDSYSVKKSKKKADAED